jgi:glutamate carboxypeptidase
MKPKFNFSIAISTALLIGIFGVVTTVGAQTKDAPVINKPTSIPSSQASLYANVEKEKNAYLETLKKLVEIESGSADIDGLDKISLVISNRLKALGGVVEFVAPSADLYRMSDTPSKVGKMVKAQFTGTGTKKLLLIAHMDTVYAKGMLKKQPFRIDGDRAYGLGIQDDKQGIALIFHILNVLNKNQFKDYGKITVLINADEEVSSPASRQLLVKLGAEHDATLSFEGSLYNLDLISLTTSGVGALNLNVTGKASHAGASPETGRNALYELAFQIQQMRNLSNASEGLKVNWTLANAGSTRNVIPSNATASADVRILKSDSFDKLENQLKEIVKTKQIPDTVVDITLERRRPALAASPKSLAMGDYAKKIYAELGRDLVLITTAVGAGTDAAFAAQDTDNPVIESLGLQGFGAHSDNDEYVLVSSITPRMYLATRLIMDLSQGKINLK